MKRDKDKNDIKNGSQEDLVKMLKEQRDKLQALKFDFSAGKIKSANEIRHLKKNIARISTQLSVMQNARTSAKGGSLPAGQAGASGEKNQNDGAK